VWLVLAAVFGTCLLPVAIVVTVFTTTSELAASVVGPMVCPAGSTAIIERVSTTYIDEQGFEREAMGAEMVCADASGEVVARPAPLPNWIWTGLVMAAAILLACMLALVFAAPLGVVVGGVINRLTRKKAVV
jgi:hypothetical protein